MNSSHLDPFRKPVGIDRWQDERRGGLSELELDDHS
jgi:hypothetical protein